MPPQRPSASLARPTPSPLIPPRRADLVWFGLFVALLAILPLLALTGDPTLTVAEKFYRTGSLVFGGGHVVLPLLEAELVAPGLIARDLFLAGYGAAQAVPGPLFSFAAYTGALLGNPPNGLWGATLALVMIYLPSFFLVFATLDWWQSLRRNERLRNGLNLANAAVVGLLLATLYDPVATSSITAWPDLIWAAAALALLFTRVPPPLVVLASALLGRRGDARLGPDHGRRATRSISTSAPTASAVTPTVVRAGSLPCSKKLGHSCIQRRIVPLELRQVDSRHCHMLQPEADTAQHHFQVFHHPLRLRLHPFGQRRIRRRRIGRHLPGDEHPAIRFDRMAERRDGPRARRDHVIDGQAHRRRSP